jgi:hypothetical protein
MNCTHPAAAAAERTFQETMTESLPPFNRPEIASEQNSRAGSFRKFQSAVRGYGSSCA